MVPTSKAIIKTKDGNVCSAILIANYAAKAGECNTYFVIKQVICSQDESADDLFVKLEELMIAQRVPTALTKFSDNSYRSYLQKFNFIDLELRQLYEREFFKQEW